jgi:hypothetical protein
MTASGRSLPSAMQYSNGLLLIPCNALKKTLAWNGVVEIIMIAISATELRKNLKKYLSLATREKSRGKG